MKLKGLVDEDFVNYKKPSMFLIFPHCSFKCEKDCGVRCCQNSGLSTASSVEVSVDEVVNRYCSNPITSSIVCGGLEPMDDFDDLFDLLNRFRERCLDDFIIYTGYTEDECRQNGWLQKLSKFENVIVKFGRYIPNRRPHFDEVLGVNLASENQYAKHL